VCAATILYRSTANRLCTPSLSNPHHYTDPIYCTVMPKVPPNETMLFCANSYAFIASEFRNIKWLDVVGFNKTFHDVFMMLFSSIVCMSETWQFVWLLFCTRINWSIALVQWCSVCILSAFTGVKNKWHCQHPFGFVHHPIRYLKGRGPVMALHCHICTHTLAC